MNEEKDLLENEEVTEAEVEETVVTEETEVEETVDVVEDGAEAGNELGEDYVPDEETEEVKEGGKISAGAAAAIAVAVCVVLMLAGYFLLDKQHKDYVASLNHYNLNKDGYVMTLEKAAEQSRMTLDEYKTANAYPAELPGDTILSVAETYIPAFEVLKKDGRVLDDASFEEFKAELVEVYEIDPALITKEMPYGALDKIIIEARDKTALFKLMGSDDAMFEQYKEMYKMFYGVEITKEMTYGEFEDLMAEAQKKAQEEADAAEESETESEEAEEIPAEDETVSESAETAPEQSEAAPAE